MKRVYNENEEIAKKNIEIACKYFESKAISFGT